MSHGSALNRQSLQHPRRCTRRAGREYCFCMERKVGLEWYSAPRWQQLRRHQLGRRQHWSAQCTVIWDKHKQDTPRHIICGCAVYRYRAHIICMIHMWWDRYVSMGNALVAWLQRLHPRLCAETQRAPAHQLQSPRQWSAKGDGETEVSFDPSLHRYNQMEIGSGELLVMAHVWSTLVDE